MAMTRRKNIVFCLDGTYRINNHTPSSWLGHVFKNLMCNPKHTLLQIYNHCEEENKYYFAGPGSEICSNNPSVLSNIFYSIFGGIDGHIGTHGIENSLQNLISILTHHGNKALDESEEIALTIFSYSRGGFLAWRLKKELSKLITEEKLPIGSLHLYNIDPVPGTFTDRFRLYLHGSKPDPDIQINSTTYFSDTGNLHIWPFSRINTPFFSGLLEESTQAWIVKANHEAISGACDDGDPEHPDILNSKAVLGHIIENCYLKFDCDWKKMVINEGRISLKKCAGHESMFNHKRGYLNANSMWSSFVPSKKELQPLAAVFDVKNAGDIYNEEDILGKDSKRNAI